MQPFGGAGAATLWPAWERSSGLLFRERQFLHHCLTHEELLRLSGDGHREAIDEAHIARRLVMRDRGEAEGDDVGFAQGRALAAANPYAQLLAVTPIGDAESLHVGDRRVGEKEFLDFARIDVLAAPDDHVLEPTDNVAITIRVDCRQVAGMHVASLVDYARRRGRIVPIAAHDAVAAGEQLSRNSRPHDSAFLG